MNFDKKSLIAAAVLAALALPVGAQESRLEEWQGQARDAWIDGKLEASYLINSELNNFDIITQVENGNVVLTGKVRSETEKQLAGEIAQNLEGVVGVDNQLTVVPETDPGADVAGGESRSDAETSERNFSTRFW